MPFRTRCVAPAAGVASRPEGREIFVLHKVVTRLARAQGYDDVVFAVLDAMCDECGWDLGAMWVVDDEAGILRYHIDCQRAPELSAQLHGATLDKGVGVSGQAWQRGEIVLSEDYLPDPSAAAHAIGERFASTLGVPITRGGRIVGVLQFVSWQHWTRTEARMELMATLGDVVSQALDRVRAAEESDERARDSTAVNAVLREVTGADSEDEAVRIALDTIRAEFGWEYGSFWAIDPAERVLRFAIESGDAGPEFREVTQSSTFAEGVGVAGRTWGSRDLVFEPDLGVVNDCVRAPAAQRAGVKAGVCVPIVIDGAVVGTMDFFATRSITLSPARREALRNTAFLVSHALDRNRANARIGKAGRSLMASIGEVEENLAAARDVAASARAITDDAQRIVTDLDTSSGEIGVVVKTITSIAEQTNLLALNATIEAARAGEAGKGFAVVAGEVKELARETAAATEEVSSRVTAIQSDSVSVRDALVEVARTVAQINDAQEVISSVLTEQAQVTRSVLDV